MENKNFIIIVDYLAKEFNLDKNKIKLETSLMSDIGLDGDDVLGFLIKFFKTFDIEYEKTNYKDFIPEEKGFIFSTFLSLVMLFKRKIDKNEIFVKDLVISLENKIWYKKKY